MLAFLRETEVRDIEPETTERFHVHRKVLDRKQEIRDVFNEIQKSMMDLRDHWCQADEGLEIELGSGVYPLKENYKNVIATDVIAGPLVDQVLDAQDMKLPNESVKALYGQNCFHHFPNPELFFQECIRVLKPGGVVVLVDPAHTLLAARLYPILFPFEDYNKSIESWTDRKGLKGPNQALSYIVFNRDRERFQSLYPQLEIVHEDILKNYARYLLSGGLNFKPVIPRGLFPLVKWTEQNLSSMRKLFGLHHVYVLRKRQIGS